MSGVLTGNEGARIFSLDSGQSRFLNLNTGFSEVCAIIEPYFAQTVSAIGPRPMDG